MTLKLVSNREDISANLRRFADACKAGPANPKRAIHDRLVRLGGCFVVYQDGDDVAFAPSRFVGYRDNDVLKHLDRLDKTDGRQTTRHLDGVLGEAHRGSEALEERFQRFCNGRKIVPPMTGPGGSERKFWLSMLPDSLLDTVEIDYLDRDPNLNPTERRALRAARIGQGKFKTDLLRLWKCCCLTGVAIGAVLRASHMKPWRSSDNAERLDVYNGLLLTPNADALFDAGLITFTDEGDLRVSSRISRKDVVTLLGKELRRVSFSPKHLDYLRYHRNNVFVDR